MPRYRVGTRVFESATDAEAFRLAHPEAPSVFVEPDAPHTEADLRDAKDKRRANLPWIVACSLLGFEIVMRVVLVQMLLRGHAPPVGAFEILLHALEFALVWWVTSVLSAPTLHSRVSVMIASFLTFLAMIGLTAEIVAGVWLYRRFQHYAEMTALMHEAPLGTDSAPLGVAVLPTPDAGPAPAARTWSPYVSSAGRFTTTFPGRPIESAGAVELHTSDGATFTVRYSPLRGRTTSNATRSRLVAERDTMLERTGGVLLDDHDLARHDGLERVVRIGIASPPTVVMARLVAVRGMLYVAGASFPASVPDTDARTFLASLVVAATP